MGASLSPRIESQRNALHRTAQQRRLNGTMKTEQAISLPTSSLNSKMLHKGVQVLSKTLPSGFQNFFTLRYGGRRNGREVYGCYVVCPECGAKPDRDIVPPHRRWQWMTAHTLVAHKQVFIPKGRVN